MFWILIALLIFGLSALLGWAIVYIHYRRTPEKRWRNRVLRLMAEARRRVGDDLPQRLRPRPVVRHQRERDLWRVVVVERIARREPRGNPRLFGRQDAVGVVTQRLIGARAVKTPDARLVTVADHLGLAAEERRWFGPVDPDVLSLIRHVHSLLFAVGWNRRM